MCGPVIPVTSYPSWSNAVAASSKQSPMPVAASWSNERTSAAPSQPTSLFRCEASENTVRYSGAVVSGPQHSPSRAASRLSRWIANSQPSESASASSPIRISTDLDVHAKAFTPQSSIHSAGSEPLAAEHLVRTTRAIQVAPTSHSAPTLCTVPGIPAPTSIDPNLVRTTRAIQVAPTSHSAPTLCTVPGIPAPTSIDPKLVPVKRPGSNILCLSAVVPQRDLRSSHCDVETLPSDGEGGPVCGCHDPSDIMLAMERLRSELEMGHQTYLRSVMFAAACSQVQFPPMQTGTMVLL